MWIFMLLVCDVVVGGAFDSHLGSFISLCCYDEAAPEEGTLVVHGKHTRIEQPQAQAGSLFPFCLLRSWVGKNPASYHLSSRAPSQFVLLSRAEQSRSLSLSLLTEAPNYKQQQQLQQSVNFYL